MFIKSIAALSLAACSLAFSITAPSGQNFWVQFTSNVIDWTTDSGDPSFVDITITNPNSTFLNGAFSIARNLDTSNGTFTVTNVTLRQASGYVVNFVNGTNQTQIFASSQPFSVEKPGTPPSGAANSTATASGAASSATSPSGNSTASGSGSSGAGSPTASSSRGASTGNAGVRAVTFVGQGAPAVALSGLAALLAAFAMF